MSGLLRLTFIVCCISVLSGCSRIEERTKSVHNVQYPSFVVQDNVAGCVCAPISERFAKAELGLDPAKQEYTWQTAEELLVLLVSEAEKTGSKIIVRDVNECLEELAVRPEPGPAKLTLLIHSNGHIYLLLGTVMLGDTLAYQIIHGDSAVWLIDEKTLRNASFSKAWQFENKAETIPVQIGNTRMELNHHYFNFGKVLPAAAFETVVNLKNCGKNSLIFKTPETSCRCTVADIHTDSDLQPGETREFKVQFQSSASASERHPIVLPVYEKGTGVSKKIEFLFLASQQQSMTIEPLIIDFGRVVPGEKYTRTINLSEVPTDRFSIVKVDANKRPFKGSWETIGSHLGLNTYQAGIEFEPDGQIPNRSEDYFIIETDSILRPKVQIFYTFELIPEISTEPGTISLGSIKADTVHEERVKIISRKNEKVVCEVRQKPECCTIEIFQNGNSAELLVGLKPSKYGVWQDKITVAVKTSSREDVLEIVCAGYIY